MNSEFQFLSVSEAAEILGISGGRVRQLLLAGLLKGHKLGERQWAIDPVCVAQRKVTPTPRGRPFLNPNDSKNLSKS